MELINSTTLHTKIVHLEKWSLLSVVRFFLASIVAISHLPPASFDYTKYIRHASFEAVLGFLLISGYSIAESYHARPNGFYLRRAKRIYPVYIASIAIMYISLILFNESTPRLFVLALNCLFFNQLFTTVSFVGPAWSLSLEVWLYSLAPLLKKLSMSSINRLVALSFTFYMLYKLGQPIYKWQSPQNLGYGINLLILAFPWISGCCISWQSNKRKALFVSGGYFVTHLSLICILQFAYRIKNNTIADYWVDLLYYSSKFITLGLVWLAIFWIWKRNQGSNKTEIIYKKSAFLCFLGDISYPLYLIHLPIFYILSKISITNHLLSYTVVIIASIVVFYTTDRYSLSRMKNHR